LSIVTGQVWRVTEVAQGILVFEKMTPSQTQVGCIYHSQHPTTK